MKKTDFILIGGVLLLIVLALFSTSGNVVLEDVEYPLTLAGDVGLHQITYSQYNEFVDNDDAFILIIERAGCGYCQMYMPIIEEVANEKKIPIYYIDTDTLTSEEFNSLNKSNAYLKRNKWGTPTTLFMLGDRVLDSIGEYVGKDSFLKFIDGKVVVGE
jgi:predicted bacteriocin transport accessory protein